MRNSKALLAAGLFVLLASRVWASHIDPNLVPIWMSLKPLQCMDNAWEKDWLSRHKNNVAKYPHLQEQTVMRQYFAKRGVSVLELRLKTALAGQTPCTTCGCERGDTLFVQVRNQDSQTMRAFGFQQIPNGTKLR